MDEQSEIVRVLLVEDNPADARLIQEMLAEVEDLEFAVTNATRLSDGLERLAEGGIDLVLLDLSLPDAQGMATLQTVRSQASEVPVVVLTGLDDQETAAGAVEEGAQDYLVKARVNSDSLVRVIKYGVERNRILLELRQRKTELEASEKRFEDQRNTFASVLADTSDQFERKVQELSVVRRIAESLKYSRDVQKVFEVIIDTIIDETNAENCSLMLLDSEANELSVRAVRGQTDPASKFFQAAEATGRRFQVGEGIAGWVAQKGEPVSMPDIASGIVVPFYPELDGQGDPVPVTDLSEAPQFVIQSDPGRPIGSLLCLPLILDNEVIGVVNMSHPRPKAFGDEERNLITLITDQAAIALRNVQIFDTMRRTH